MILTRDFAPALARAEVGHGHVALDLGDDFGQLDAVGDRLEQVEDRRSADDRNRLVAGQRDRAVDVMRDLGALDLPVRDRGS